VIKRRNNIRKYNLLNDMEIDRSRLSMLVEDEEFRSKVNDFLNLDKEDPMEEAYRYYEDKDNIRVWSVFLKNADGTMSVVQSISQRNLNFRIASGLFENFTFIGSSEFSYTYTNESGDTMYFLGKKK